MPCQFTLSLTASFPPPSSSSQENRTTRPSEKFMVSSLQTRGRPRVPMEGARTDTWGTSWWRHNMRLLYKSLLSAWPTPVKHSSFWHGHTPLLRRGSFESTWGNFVNTTSVVTSIPHYATNSSRHLRIYASPPSITCLRASPEQQRSSC